PQYIGGTITGELLIVETFKTDENGNIFYQFKDQSKTENNPSNREERMKHILSYKPVVRP
ncbi:hypothetical protein, partial [Pectobacterium versatile]|uniref:hypothetical protein n=1 Tax=Pectobacterium versatile TaxID=2488639 RepID=UPI002B23F1B3